ncbi:hypothetical protein C2E23DRAFT_441759 [Lenzites betulinus]|nr:hypothetical protein C2E23DRAFT_441759 [Lenzites betulinus]
MIHVFHRYDDMCGGAMIVLQVCKNDDASTKSSQLSRKPKMPSSPRGRRMKTETDYVRMRRGIR